MIDFTSSLYLGLRHASGDLRPWARLTTGGPALLGEPPVAGLVAARLARLTGVEAAVLVRSTLHAFWDLIVWLSRTIEPATVLLDAGAYPVARWGVERAACRGVPTSAFPHHSATHVERLVVELSKRGRRPILVADGFCPGCGNFAPVRGYVEIAEQFRGVLVLDDTQALGVAGPGGGGSLRRAGVSGDVCVLVNSLAKGFGAPLAFVGGSRHLIGQFGPASDTRAHSSPPSSADLHAAVHALVLNRSEGALRRKTLAARVARFRRGLSGLSLAAIGEASPIQTLRSVPRVTAHELHARLEAGGVRTVLHRPSCGADERVTFLLTAAHSRAQIDTALVSLAAAIRSAHRAHPLSIGAIPR